MNRELDPDMLAPSHYPLLGFPEPAWLWFAAACADSDIPDPTPHRARLEAIYSHLVGVNEWMNLTRIIEPADFLKFHVFDSLTALPIVEDLSEPGDLCIDLGSGGGYPGLPLATWLPDRRWILVDSRSKKVAFLKQALTLTPCPRADARAFRGREVRSAAPELAGQATVVLARAVGRAERLLEESADVLRENGFLLILKGPSYEHDERHAFAAACPRFGFEPLQEFAASLDPGDPERIMVLAAKTEAHPGKTRHHHGRGRARQGTRRRTT